jgi:hypothetical protein
MNKRLITRTYKGLQKSNTKTTNNQNNKWENKFSRQFSKGEVLMDKKYTHKKMFIILSHKGNGNRNATEIASSRNQTTHVVRMQ